MEKKKNKNYFIISFIGLFSIFLILYISKETGYLEYKAHNKAVVTEENMKSFERDLALGKDVSINEYVSYKDVDYTNVASELGYKVGTITETIMNEGLKKTLKIFSALFYE